MALQKRFAFRNFVKKINVFRNAKAVKLKQLREQLRDLKIREEVVGEFHQRRLDAFYDSMRPLIQMGFKRAQIDHITDVLTRDLRNGKKDYGKEARELLEKFSLGQQGDILYHCVGFSAHREVVREAEEKWGKAVGKRVALENKMRKMRGKPPIE